MDSAAIEQVDDANFDTEVLHATRPTVVAFAAGWSRAWQKTSRHFERLAARNAEDVRSVWVDVDANAQTASAYAVRAMPTFLLFVDGRAVARLEGSAGDEQLGQLYARAETE